MHKISHRKFVHQTTKTAPATVITAGAIVNT